MDDHENSGHSSEKPWKLRDDRNLFFYLLHLKGYKPTSQSMQSDSIPKNPTKRTKKHSLSLSASCHKQDKRPRSASAGRDPEASLRARHWGFLFRNLEQAVGEIYQTCEDDESIIECKEAILMLERYTSDFYKLIEWLKLKWEFENTPPPERPTSISWEIRTSPGKVIPKERRSQSAVSARTILQFDKKSSVDDKKEEIMKDITKDSIPSHSVQEFQGASKDCRETKLICNVSDENVNESGTVELNAQLSTINNPDAENSIRKPNSTKDESHKDITTNRNISVDSILETIPESKIVSDNSTPKDISVNLSQSTSTDAKCTEFIEKSAITPVLESTSFDVKYLDAVLSKKSCGKSNSSAPKAVRSRKKFSKSKVISQHLHGNGCKSCNMIDDREKIVFMDKQKFDHFVPCAEDTEICEDKKISFTSERDKGEVASVEHEYIDMVPESSNTEPHINKINEKIESIKSKSATPKQSVNSKIVDIEPKKPAVENMHPKIVKPAPLVNMNKASQVRQAYNQSRTPSKTPCVSTWKSSDQKSPSKPLNTTSSRNTVRRSCEGKSLQSPPLRKRVIEVGNVVRGNGLERSNSSISFTSTKQLVRSATTLADSQIFKRGVLKQNIQCNKSQSSSKIDETSSSFSSLVSCSNTSSGQSWADKVRGSTTSVQNPSQSEISVQDDDEGWEVVRRGRRSHSGSSASLNSPLGGSFFKGQQILQQVPKKSFMKNRFNQPSTTVSMPSLVDNNARANDPAGYSHISGRSSNKCSTPPSEWNTHSLSSRKRIKNYQFNSSKEPKNKKVYDRKKIKNKKQDSNEDTKGMSNSSFDSDCHTPPTEKFKKNISNNSKKNEMRRNLFMEANEISGQDDLLTSKNGFISNGGNQYSNSSLEEASMTDDEKQKFLNGLDLINRDGNSGHVNAEGSTDLPDGSESEEEEEMIRNNAAALESADQEERRLKQQIHETEMHSIEVSEDVEIEEEDEFGPSEKELKCSTDQSADDSLSSSKNVDNFYSYNNPRLKKLSELSWAEEMDAIDKMDSIRHPGRVLHIHEKLSSPSRKLPMSEKLRRHQEKLDKAEELRQKLLYAKSRKLKHLNDKVDELKDDKDRLLLEKRKLLERKMQRADEKRKIYLQEIVNKAHDEDNKAREIAFINGLEAQNKLHDIMQQHQSHESRLADIAEERSRKQEEKAAKEAAAQERRKALEAERQARMVELCEKRRRRFEKIDRQQAERREELLEQAREKARDREERRSALQQAQQAKESELVRKIQQKQEETARRHEENIELIRQRALESSITRYSRGCDDAPKLLRYERKKLCTLCSSLIASDVYLLSHLRGKQHQEAFKALYKDDVSNEETVTYNLKHIVDAPVSIDDPQIRRDKERQKALKKRCRKIRTRMVSRGREYLAEYAPSGTQDGQMKTKIAKALQQIGRLLSDQGTGPWPAADVALLDKHLLEVLRLLERKDSSIQDAFAGLDGFQKISSVLTLITEDGKSGCVVPSRSLGYCGKILVSASHSSFAHSRYLLYSNVAGYSVEQLLQRLNDLSSELVRCGSSSSLNTLASLPPDPAAVALMELLAQILEQLTEHFNSESCKNAKEDNDGIWQRLQDVISYCVSTGIVDKITWYFNHLQSPLDNDDQFSGEFIMAAMRILSSLARSLLGKHLSGDPTQLIGTIHVTEACGVVSLLYGLLLHQGGRSSSPPPQTLLTKATLSIAATALNLLQNLAQLDLSIFQSILGSEGISLEIRHIGSFLLWYCSHWPCEDVLHNLISVVGYFSVNNRENQMVIQSGETPSVLQQLCSLPWQYFTEPRLTCVLFPTLLSCCWENEDNMKILLQEMSFQVLEDFLKSDQAKSKPLVQNLRKFILPQIQCQS